MQREALRERNGHGRLQSGDRIYTTMGGKPQMIARKAVVNGVLALAYVKGSGEEMISYLPYSDLVKLMESDSPCLHFRTGKIESKE